MILRGGLNLLTMLALGLAGPVHAQQQVSQDGEGEGLETPQPRRLEINPYVELDQIINWQFEPVDNATVYTRAAAGVDASVNGRNSGGTLSLRYEHNFAWGDNGRDSDTVSGLARGYTAIIPRELTIEAGALATRTSVDGSGRTLIGPIVDTDFSTATYSAYAGPNLSTRVGALDVEGYYRLGYTRVDTPEVITVGDFTGGGFDESWSHSARLRAGTRPGDPLPIGVGVGAGFYQEDINTLDQQVRDLYARGDVMVPIGEGLALVGGAGVEDVRVSSRDALRDEDGNPIVDSSGRYVTDPASPRTTAFEADGLIWDIGVIWRPSRRTSLEARFGHRYDSETAYGSFNWQATSRSTISVNVYDGIQGFGGRLTNSLANLPIDFEIIRDPVTGEIIGCTSSIDGSNCLDSLLGSVRSSVFRGRGVNAGYSHRIGRMTANFAVGYDRRSFIGAPGTVLEAANGVVDENWYANTQLTGPLGSGRFTLASFANRYEAGRGGNDVTALGASAAYSQPIWRNLSAHGGLSLTSLDSDQRRSDIKVLTALVGLRYNF